MNEANPQQAGHPPEGLVKAIRKILRPLVRLMLSHQISYPFLINMLKSIYVEVAETEFEVDGKRSSDSRINLLTGVHRKDVKRLRNEDPVQNSVPRQISVGAQLVARWMGEKEFQDDKGNPRDLVLRSGGGDRDRLQAGSNTSSNAAGSDGEHSREVSFDDLVERVCRQDIRPRVILDEWLHLGLVSLNEQGRVHLNTGSFIPEKGFDEKVFFFGKNLHDHIAAGTDNLLGQQPARFDRSVYYDRLSEESVQELNALAETTGMQALRSMNRAALALQQRDRLEAGTAGKQYRMNFGVFNYNTAYNPTEATTNPETADTSKPQGKESKGGDHA